MGRYDTLYSDYNIPWKQVYAATVPLSGLSDYAKGPLPGTGTAADTLKAQISDQIFSGSPLLDYLKKTTKEKDMSTEALVRDANAKRKTKRIETLLDELDYLHETEYSDGSVWSWTLRFADRDKDYVFAAVRVGRSWYTTDHVKGSLIDTDELIERIISSLVDGGDLVVAPVAVS